MTPSERDNRLNIAYTDAYTSVYVDEGKCKGDVRVQHAFFSPFS